MGTTRYTGADLIVAAVLVELHLARKAREVRCEARRAHPLVFKPPVQLKSASQLVLLLLLPLPTCLDRTRRLEQTTTDRLCLLLALFCSYSLHKAGALAPLATHLVKLRAQCV